MLQSSFDEFFELTWPLIVPVAVFIIGALSLIVYMNMRTKLQWKRLAAELGLTFKLVDKERDAYMSLAGELQGIGVVVRMMTKPSKWMKALFDEVEIYSENPGIQYVEVCVEMPEAWLVMDADTLEAAKRRHPVLRGFRWSDHPYTGFRLTSEGLIWRELWVGGNKEQLEDAMFRLVALRKRLDARK